MLQKPFAPEDYTDDYREALLELIRAKLEGIAKGEQGIFRRTARSAAMREAPDATPRGS